MAPAPKPPFELPPSTELNDPLLREALAWLVHLHSGAETSDDWASFADWKATGENYAAAATKAEQLWERLGPALARNRPSRRPGVSIILAGIIGLAGVAFALGLFGTPSAYFADYRSGIGEVRTVRLADGSTVDLDTSTSFDVDPGERTLTLYSGQIFVAVSPNGAKPFTVLAGKGRVQALGTAFAVKWDDDAVAVAVAEHAVRVSYGDGAKRRSVDIVSGEGVRYSPHNGLEQEAKVNVADITGWRRGQFIFNDRPLGEVLHEIQRYQHGRIVILDGGLGSLPVTGTHDIRRVDDFLESLHVALPIKLVALPGLTLIWRDTSRSGVLPKSLP